MVAKQTEITIYKKVDKNTEDKNTKKHTRSTIKLEVPLTRTTFGDRSFAVDGPRVWNSLPASIRDPSLSLTVFTNSLKTYLFRQ